MRNTVITTARAKPADPPIHGDRFVRQTNYDLQPEIWTVQNGNFLVISPAGRRENSSHEGVEIFGTADCADLEAG